MWDAEISKQGEPARIDILKWLSKTTLDIIGLAGKSTSMIQHYSLRSLIELLLLLGFNYRFDALNPHGEPNELVVAFNEIFDPSPRITAMMLLKNFFPVLDIFVCIL